MLKNKSLPNAGLTLFPLGLGCMGMSGMYGQADEAECIATIHEAIDQGITFLDTGDFYGMGQNELLVGRSISGQRHKVQLSVKFGAMRGPDGAWLGFDARPAAVKSFLAYTLNRLNVDYIDVYRPARLDPGVPIEDTIGAIADLVKAGYVRHIGLSEVGVETIRRAHAVHPISDLQIEYSLMSRGPESRILPVLKELGIGVTAYGVLSRGLLAGTAPSHLKDYRGHMPRFSAENREKNSRLVEALHKIAKANHVSGTQLAIAWVLAQGDTILPIPGCRTRAQLKEALGALSITLSVDDLAQLEAAVPHTEVAGTRYDANAMRSLDSER